MHSFCRGMQAGETIAQQTPISELNLHLFLVSLPSLVCYQATEQMLLNEDNTYDPKRSRQTRGQRKREIKGQNSLGIFNSNEILILNPSNLWRGCLNAQLFIEGVNKYHFLLLSAFHSLSSYFGGQFLFRTPFSELD